MASQEDIQRAMVEGFTFKPGASGTISQTNKVKTKARKKAYITGAHGSASARKKADIRKRVANRPSQRKARGE